MCIHVQLWRCEGQTLGIFLDHCQLFETRSLTEYGAVSAGLGSTYLCHNHHHPSNGATAVTSGFYVDCGIQTPVKHFATEPSLQPLSLLRGKWWDRFSRWIRLDWPARDPQESFWLCFPVLWLQMCTHVPDVYMSELRFSWSHCILPTEKPP